MPDHRINIIGASGVGKTTLAEALGKKLGIPTFDSDFYFHEQTDPPFQKARDPQVRHDLIKAAMADQKNWILSGTVALWLPEPILEYTLIVFLYLPPVVRLERLRQREKNRFGKRIEAGGDMEETYRDFMEWTQGYDTGTSEGTNNWPLHEALLKYKNCPQLRFMEPMPTEVQVEQILQTL